MTRKLLLLLAAMSGCSLWTSSRNASQINSSTWPARLRDDLTAFSHDSMLGRQAGTQGAQLAADFLVARLQSLDLVPLGDGGTYLQRVTWTRRTTAGPQEVVGYNVVAAIRGSDSLLSTQYVALGAHLDHVGRAKAVDHDSLRAFNTVVRPGGLEDIMRSARPEDAPRVRQILDSLRVIRPPRVDTVNNGADDDGSGSIGLLAIAEALAHARVPLKRSILLVWHTGEELGMVGSRAFTDHPTVPLASIVAQLNVDMIGRGGAADLAGGGPSYLQLVGSRRLSTALGDLIEQVNTAQRLPFTFDYAYDAIGEPHQFYCRSDHYMYARFGIPVAFFSTGGHRDYHMPTDEAQYIDFDKMYRVSRLIHDVAVELANQAQPPRLDGPKPDPTQPCKQ